MGKPKGRRMQYILYCALLSAALRTSALSKYLLHCFQLSPFDVKMKQEHALLIW